jgi:alkyldihydroxyacetonephosphate synthase
LSALLGGPPAQRRAPPTASDLALREPRARPPASLAELADDTPVCRATPALGRSYRDLVRATRARFDTPPDAVLFPESDADVARILEAAAAAEVAVIPFGGGTSVCGGVEPLVGERFAGAWTLSLARMTGVREVDETSLAARVAAGTLGPDLEAALKPHGLTLRHFPQSFELSTLGGWIATRAGGHFATVYTHIDDLVESLSLVSPAGRLVTRRLPASGAGPLPERMFLGSEGALGVITEAWVRLFRRPTYRASATVAFDGFLKGAAAARAIAQSGLHPSNARLIDGPEALMSGAGAGDASLLLLAFESADAPQEASIRAAVDLARAHGGRVDDGAVRSTHDPSGGRDATADTYKSSFFRAPYLRDELVLRDIFVETYETAIPWSGLEQLDAAVRSAVEALALGPHLVACRLTHVYRDGAAPYYTVITRAAAGAELEQADRVKHAITAAIIEAGGTSTHHHAVGRDVMPFYRAERPQLFADALAGAKRALDPSAIMNPGVLVDASPSTA